jgi:hypothetical protein
MILLGKPLHIFPDHALAVLSSNRNIPPMMALMLPLHQVHLA